MLIEVEASATDRALATLFAVCDDLGYAAKFVDSGRRILELRRARRSRNRAARARLEDVTCVVRVIDASDEEPHLSERGPDGSPTIVRAGQAQIGGGAVALIAGPCAVEDPATVLRIARTVKAAGACLLRGGAYKPRTSPYSFQGLRDEGLSILRAVRDEVGIGVVTEVLDPRDVAKVAGAADMLQIGARNMSNSSLLREVGRAGVPVLLKRGLAATSGEWLMAAEYVMEAGNPHVVLCERGIRGFDSATRNVLDLGSVAFVKLRSHLPVVVDPSHASGRAALVLPLARAALAVGADGLLVDVHDDPALARCDGAQALRPSQFETLSASAAALVALDGRWLSSASRPFVGGIAAALAPAGGVIG